MCPFFERRKNFISNLLNHKGTLILCGFNTHSEKMTLDFVYYIWSLSFDGWCSAFEKNRRWNRNKKNKTNEQQKKNESTKLYWLVFLCIPSMKKKIIQLNPLYLFWILPLLHRYMKCRSFMLIEFIAIEINFSSSMLASTCIQHGDLWLFRDDFIFFYYFFYFSNIIELFDRYSKCLWLCVIVCVFGYFFFVFNVVIENWTNHRAKPLHH